MVVGVLIYYELLQKQTSNMSNSGTYVLQFKKKGHNATEATKSICCAKGEGTVIIIPDGSRNFAQVARTSKVRYA